MPKSLKPWNWQLPDWPHFRYEAGGLLALEAEFMRLSGVHVGVFSHLGDEDREVLRTEILSDEAMLTSRIEGEVMNRDSLQSSIRRLFGLAHDGRRVRPAERGISELQVDLYRTSAAPLTDEKLFEWHRMCMRGRLDLSVIGAYRRHAEPMRIISGPVHDPVVHFEAPPSTLVTREMRKFIQWFNRPVEPLTGISRAGTAHLYFESIHPFEDGNGRIGRAIAEMALSQAMGQPTLIAISTVIEKRRKSYYEALQKASRSNYVGDWLEFFGSMVIEAQMLSLKRVEFLVYKAKFFIRFRDLLNPRQEKVVLRVFREGIDGFAGGLSSANYVSITQCSPATATRDLAGLVQMGAMTRSGELKHARYFLNLSGTM
jgi:Fic family protein